LDNIIYKNQASHTPDDVRQIKQQYSICLLLKQ